jgi:integrase
MTFDEAFRKFFAHKSHEFSSDKYRKYWQDTMRLYVSPIIGKLPVPAIQLPHILSVLEPIWIEKSATASKVRQRIEAVLDWCTVRGVRSGDNPARWDGNLAVLLPKPSKINGGTKHHDALPVADLPAFMADLRERGGVAARAMELAVLCASRTSEVIGAQWHEFDLAGKAWTVPAERMKAKREHVVPLTDAAVALLKSLPRSPGSDYVFDKNGKKLADSALYNLLKVRMQVDATPHGFRSSFKDWARTMTQYADEVSELCLAHVDSDSTRAAYARDGLLDLRRKMLKDWANYLKRSK